LGAHEVGQATDASFPDRRRSREDTDASAGGRDALPEEDAVTFIVITGRFRAINRK
jgi:hypothetical protein